MSTSLLVDAYLKLPQPQSGDDPDLLQAGIQDAMREFRDEVRAKYTEGTLHRLLASAQDTSRRAAALALGLIGTMKSNAPLAVALKDTDTLVRKFAADSLWEVWFRAGSPEQNSQLREATALADVAQMTAALDELIREAPDFAEAYNQRAVVLFRRGDYSRSVNDCEAALRLNPYHFGAASGMGQSFLRMNKPRAALRAFQQAIEINPDLVNLSETIRGLEAALGGASEAD